MEQVKKRPNDGAGGTAPCGLVGIGETGICRTLRRNNQVACVDIERATVAYRSLFDCTKAKYWTLAELELLGRILLLLNNTFSFNQSISYSIKRR